MTADGETAARAGIGATSVPWTYELTRPGIRRYARAFQLTERMYYWVEAARAAGWPDLPAPFGYLGEPVYVPGFSDAVFSDPGWPDVVGGDADVLDLGTAHEVVRVPCAGERLTCITTIVDIAPASYRIGAGVRVDRELVFRDQADELVLRQRRSTLHYHGQ